MQLPSDGPSGGVLQLDGQFNGCTVREALKMKHPESTPPHPDAIIPRETPSHAIRFAALTHQSVRAAALNTRGAAGPSGIDADCWRHRCTSFRDASDTLL
eukprot:scpid94381/ scgid12464/ 